MSSSTFEFVVVAVALSSASLGVNAFLGNTRFLSTSRETQSLSLSASLNGWGAQKLGQSVISQNVSTVSVDSAAVLRLRPSTGSGSDERVDVGKLFNDYGGDASDSQTIHRIDTFFEKRKLMQALSRSSICPQEKLERINFAIHVEGYLPVSIAPSNSVRVSSTKAGNLFKDWDLAF